MEQHILFFDIDGTILDAFNGGSKVISEPLKKAFRQLQEN